MIFKKMNIDTNEVLAAAATKWNFLKFKPGLVGGHCIGVDPYYLTYKSNQLGINPKVILSGRNTNNNMPKYIIDKIFKRLKEKKQKTKDFKEMEWWGRTGPSLPAGRPAGQAGRPPRQPARPCRDGWPEQPAGPASRLGWRAEPGRLGRPAGPRQPGWCGRAGWPGRCSGAR